MNDVTIERETLAAALDALTESVDLVQHDYDSDWRHGMPTRKAQLDASLLALNQHKAAIAALRAALEAKPADPVVWADKAMELATDFGMESLRVGSSERQDIFLSNGVASWKTIALREKREAARERLRQHLYDAPPAPAAVPPDEHIRVLREALELIAAPMRPDGSWNRDREACRQIAAAAICALDQS